MWYAGSQLRYKHVTSLQAVCMLYPSSGSASMNEWCDSSHLLLSKFLVGHLHCVLHNENGSMFSLIGAHHTCATNSCLQRGCQVFLCWHRWGCSEAACSTCGTFSKCITVRCFSPSSGNSTLQKKTPSHNRQTTWSVLKEGSPLILNCSSFHLTHVYMLKYITKKHLRFLFKSKL